VKRTLEQVRSYQNKTKKAYAELFKGPMAEIVLKDLNQRFNQTTLKRTNGVIDPNASIAAAGCREVLLSRCFCTLI